MFCPGAAFGVTLPYPTLSWSRIWSHRNPAIGSIASVAAIACHLVSLESWRCESRKRVAGEVPPHTQFRPSPNSDKSTSGNIDASRRWTCSKRLHWSVRTL